MKIDADNHKLIYHPDRVSEWCTCGDCFPIYVEIGPTNRCNHHCIFCALDWLERENTDIDTEVMIKTLKDMAACGVKAVMFAGEGEPLLHKEICTFVRNAKNAGLDVALTTNGVLLTKEKLENCLPYLSWVRISLDAATDKTYRLIHRGGRNDFQKVLQNIREAVRLKRENNYNVTIGVQMLVIPENVTEILPLVKLIKETGADNIQLKPYSHHPLSRNQFNPDQCRIDEKVQHQIEKFNDQNFQVIYRKETLKRLFQERSYQECLGLPFFALIESTGNVIPCNIFYRDNNFTFGNICEQDFKTLWESKRRKRILRKIKNLGVDNCRDGCRLDALNRYLFSLRNPHPHVNFI